VVDSGWKVFDKRLYPRIMDAREGVLGMLKNGAKIA
jgi:hypothetical protein